MKFIILTTIAMVLAAQGIHYVVDGLNKTPLADRRAEQIKQITEG